MATTTWQSASSGDWSVPGDWSGGLPGPADEADITRPFAGAAYTVSLTTNETALTVVVSAANATLDISRVLSATTVQLTNGLIDLEGTIDGDTVQATGGTLNIAGELEVNTVEADGVTLEASNGVIGGPGATQWNGALVLGGFQQNLFVENGLPCESYLDTGNRRAFAPQFRSPRADLVPAVERPA